MSRDIAQSVEACGAPLADGSAFEARLAGFLSVSAQALGVPYDGLQWVLMNILRRRMLRQAGGPAGSTRAPRAG